MEYAVGRQHKHLDGQAGFDVVLHRTEERLTVRRCLSDFRGHRRVVWRGDEGKPYVRFDGQMHHIERRYSYSAGGDVWLVNEQESPIVIEVTWQR